MDNEPKQYNVNYNDFELFQPLKVYYPLNVPHKTGSFRITSGTTESE